MAHTKILGLYNHLALILNHQSSLYITENPCNNQTDPHTINQEDKIIQSLPRYIYGLAKLFKCKYRPTLYVIVQSTLYILDHFLPHSQSS